MKTGLGEEESAIEIEEATCLYSSNKNEQWLNIAIS